MSSAAWLTLGALAMIWGASFLAFALGLNELPVFTLVAHRVFWGALTLWIFVLLFRIALPRDPKIWAALLIMGLLNNAIPFSLIAWGQVSIESGLASILNGTTAMFAVILAAIAFVDEKLTPNKIAGVLVAFLGVVITMGWDSLLTFDIRSLAQWAIIGASLSYGLAAVWARLTFKGLDPIAASTGMLTGSTLIMLPLAWIIDGSPRFDLLPLTWGAALFLGIFASAISYLLYYRALNLAGSGNLSLVTLMIPPLAVFWGWLVLGETLRLNAFIGFGIIAIGLILIDGRMLKRLKSR
ncbi:MAG: DMT family transporter [Pseudomonadota bacterium]